MGKGALLMFTEGDVREIVRTTVQATLDSVLTAMVEPERVVEHVMVAVVTGPVQAKSEPHAHDCEGRLCTVCAEWRARHNLLRHGGNAD